MHLSDLKRGEKATISGYDTEEVPVKLYEMGLLPGTSVQVMHIAPFGGPYYISLNNGHYRLALRKKEARCITIDRL